MKHLDENTIQAFIDGELSGKTLNFATKHLTVCDVCANLLTRTEAEIAQFEAIFTTDAGCKVPTQRIWARIENEITVLDKSPAQQPNGVWQKVTAQFPNFSKNELFGFSLAQQIVFGGSLAGILLVSFVAIGFFQQQNEIAQIEIEAVDIPLKNNQANPLNAQTAQVTPQITKAENRDFIESKPQFVKIKQANSKTYRAEVVKSQPKFERAIYVENLKPNIESRKPKTESSNVETPKDATLPEERQYIAAIADLTKSEKTDDENAMRPSVRVQYEKSLATINQAITTMQKQVRKNPKDENARQILFASYQNKIDLLNTVSENSQLMASLK